jgi:predicted N-acetyltransferase YhbS
VGAERWAGLEPGIAALGPIGVAADARGGGLGLALLVAGLRQLRDRGAGPAVIDWTDLLDFYARAGFAPWLRYVQARRSLP